MREMEDSVVVRRLPGTEIMPGQWVGHLVTMGGPCVIRRLTPAERRAIDAHPECVRPVDPNRTVPPYTPPEEEGPQPGEPKSNAYIRLVRQDTYRGGESFTDWELLVDVPGIPVRHGSPGKPYAQKGDILREEEDELTPLRLKRDGREVASPEWWAVRHLFVGLREDAPQRKDQGEAVPSVLGAGLVPEGWLGVVFYADQTVPGTPIRAGDYLLLRWGGHERRRPNNLAPALPVPRAHLAAADAAMEDGSLRVIAVHKHAVWRDSDAEVIAQCRAKLTKPQRANWSDATSPLVIVRPLVAPVSEPIHATSDDAALFELLHQVGGRMPQEATS